MSLTAEGDTAAGLALSLKRSCRVSMALAVVYVPK